MRHINPPDLSEPTGYTHVVDATRGRTIYVSGQVALDRAGRLVGEGDLERQARQVFENLELALRAADAGLNHVVKITVFMTDVSQIQKFREVRGRFFPAALPASTLVQVVQLARPEWLIEIEAIAVVEE
jgi:reactive intermediate/imine deaminase